ncbi:MAG: anti-sigma F factor [Lachnospiraceae bacterium]|nr:anti-sigma F factor [Lachnospiraceae bacterium]MDY5577451.1 anti-sigma F factor [Lachnospiraceae bacterium]
MYKNKMHLEFDSKSENERFARVTVAAFAAQLNPIMEEISDLKTAVSEAVTNCIVHGYEGGEGTVYVDAEIMDRTVTVMIKDTGVGINDVKKAMEPLYTTKPDEDRAGMGFMFMEAFMDELEVESEPGKGTTVIMKKTIEER